MRRLQFHGKHMLQMHFQAALRKLHGAARSCKPHLAHSPCLTLRLTGTQDFDQKMARGDGMGRKDRKQDYFDNVQQQ